MYNIYGAGESRVLIVPANMMHRWKFLNDNRREIHFKRSGSKCLAVVSDKVLVYKKPHCITYHKEYMRQNAKALWLGLQAEPDRLLENMLEFIEAI